MQPPKGPDAPDHGSGETILAIAEMARLLLYAGSEGQQMRHLFLKDRRTLGKQARDEFQNYVVPDDGRKLGELFNVQLLTSNHIDASANVVISDDSTDVLDPPWGGGLRARAGGRVGL